MDESTDLPHPPSLDDGVVAPADAGAHAAGLARILHRIPDGWGRWISCGPGWYSRLVALDTEIAAFLPEYEVHQVKEKYGALRYYIGLPEVRPACCVALDATRPHPGPIDPKYLRGIERTALQQYELDEWCYTMHRPHYDSTEHAASIAALTPLLQRRRELLERAEECIRVAEADLEQVCEECAAPGSLQVHTGWYKTLCAACATARGYAPVPPKAS